MSDEIIDSGATQAQPDAATTTPVAEADATGKETTTPGLPGGEESAEAQPGEEEIPETEEAAGKLLGAPETYGEFDLSSGKDIDYKFSDEQKEAFIVFGKDYNLDDKQMNAIVAFDIARQKEFIAENDKFVESYKSDGVEASRKEHGDKYAALYGKNKLTYDKFFGEEAQKSLNDMGISSQPWFFNALSGMSAVLSEDVTVPGDATIKTKKTLAQKCGSTKT
jgi:hypothetical protein